MKSANEIHSVPIHRFESPLARIKYVDTAANTLHVTLDILNSAAFYIQLPRGIQYSIEPFERDLYHAHTLQTNYKLERCINN